MRLQSRKFSCGPGAVRNALEALGHVRTEEELKKLCGTTVEGTSAAGILRALKAVREACQLVGPSLLKQRSPEIALLLLEKFLSTGRPVIVPVRTDEPWDHWIAVGGRLGDRLVCLDSADDEIVVFKTAADFLPWWEGPAGHATPYYGIVL